MSVVADITLDRRQVKLLQCVLAVAMVPEQLRLSKDELAFAMELQRHLRATERGMAVLNGVGGPFAPLPCT